MKTTTMLKPATSTKTTPSVVQLVFVYSAPIAYRLSLMGLLVFESLSGITVSPTNRNASLKSSEKNV